VGKDKLVWRAYFDVQGVKIWLNRTFSTAKEAALARDEEAVTIFEDGTLNPARNNRQGTNSIM